jgi:hypothetical protein
MLYVFGDYALDTQRYELHRTGTLIKLRRKVFDLLAYLIVHRERVISRQELLDHLWPKQFVGEATLNSCIMEARQAVGDTGVCGRGQFSTRAHVTWDRPRRSAEAIGHFRGDGSPRGRQNLQNHLTVAVAIKINDLDLAEEGDAVV